MKRITYIIAILFACTSCSDTFLDNAPKGKYHEGNYDMGTAQELLVLATLMDGYKCIRPTDLAYNGHAMSYNG